MLALFTDDAAPGGLMLPDSLQKAKLAETVDRVVNMDYSQFLSDLAGEAVWVMIKIAGALLIWFVGRWIIRRVTRLTEAAFERRRVEPSLRSFLGNMIRVVLSALVILTVVQMLGVNMTSIVAMFASATLAIGMALSGTFQNFAGGVLILLLKPYRVGDFISAQGQSGTVREIRLFSTQIRTADNRTIYIPNSSISTSIIDNYSEAPKRRVDIQVSISYGDDVDTARAAILGLCGKDARILSDPAPAVYVSALSDSSVDLSLRMWVDNADYWSVFFDMNELIYKTLPAHGINFPFPHLDVNVNGQ